MQNAALVAGIAGIALGVVGILVSPDDFFRTYLIAYMFWLGIAMGCTAILMIHHVAGGAWSAVIRRPLESGARTLPLMAILFIPIIFGMQHLYVWARPAAVAHDAVLQHKSLYLNVPFFLVRAAIYFAVWIGVAVMLNRWSMQQDESGDPALVRRLELLSRGGLVAFGLTTSFAAIDWLMSLDAMWFSTIYGLLIMGGQALTAMAFVIVIAALLADDSPLAGVISNQQFHDLGKFLLAFVMLWTYFALSQYLIIWSGNLPEEIPWYLARQRGGWQFISIGLIVFDFALPLLILLSRKIKRQARSLAVVAIGIILIRLVDSFWLVTPAFHPTGFAIHWLDLVMPIGVGGIWFWVFVWQLKSRPLLAVNDPALPQRG